MLSSTKLLTRTAILFAAAASLSALPACRQQSGSGAETNPTAVRADLAERLKLSPDRARVLQIVSDAGSSALSFDPDKDCSDGYCTCTGDDDCNDMFSGVCSSPSTGGICHIRNDVPRCRCKDPRGA